MVASRPAAATAFGVECRNPAPTRGAMLDRERPPIPIGRSGTGTGTGTFTGETPRASIARPGMPELLERGLGFDAIR